MFLSKEMQTFRYCRRWDLNGLITGLCSSPLFSKDETAEIDAYFKGTLFNTRCECD